MYTPGRRTGIQASAGHDRVTRLSFAFASGMPCGRASKSAVFLSLVPSLYLKLLA